MALPQLVTEIIVLHLKDGVDIDSDASSGSNASFQSFVQMTNTVKSQKGHISQYWGHQVENPNLFVWFINWQSLAHATAFHDSNDSELDKDSFTSSTSQIFDVQTTAPITLYTRWNSDTRASIESLVTEVSFYTFQAPNGTNDEEAKTAVEDALKPILLNVTTVGKGTGAAIGWVLGRSPYEHAAQHSTANDSEGESREWLAGVFGYHHIDDHIKWRQTREHGQAGEIFEDLENRGLKLRIADSVPGVDPKTGYFHVKFHQGEM